MNTELEPDSINITRNGRKPEGATLTDRGLELKWADGTVIVIPESALSIDGNTVSLKAVPDKVEVTEPGKEAVEVEWDDACLAVVRDFNNEECPLDELTMLEIGELDPQLTWQATWEDSPLPWAPLPELVCPEYEFRELEPVPDEVKEICHAPVAKDDTNWVKAGMVVHCDHDDKGWGGDGHKADGWKPMQWVDGKDGEPGGWVPMNWEPGDDGMPCGCPDHEGPQVDALRGGEGGGVWVPGENGWPSGWMPDGMPDNCDGPPVVFMPMKWIPGESGSEGSWMPMKWMPGHEGQPGSWMTDNEQSPGGMPVILTPGEGGGWMPMDWKPGDDFDKDWMPQGEMDCGCAPMGMMPPVWTPQGWIVPSNPDHESYKVVMRAPIIKGQLIAGEYNGWIKEYGYDNEEGGPYKTHFADMADMDMDGDILKVSKVVAWKPDMDDGDQPVPTFSGGEGYPMPPMMVGNGTQPIEDGSMVFGQFGKLTVNMDGSYSYNLDELNKQVIKLAEGEKAQEVFHYTVIDPTGKSDEATLTITIVGSNDGPKANDDTNWVKAGMVMHCEHDDDPRYHGDSEEPDGWKPMQWADGREGEPGKWTPMDWERGEDGMPCGCGNEEMPPAPSLLSGGEEGTGVWVPGENGWPAGWMPDGMPDNCDGPPVIWMPMKWVEGENAEQGSWEPMQWNQGDEYNQDLDCGCAPVEMMPPVWTPQGWVMPAKHGHDSYKVVMSAPIIKGELIEGEYNGWIKEGREYDNFDNAQARPGGGGNYDKTHFADVADKDWDNYDVLKVSKVVAWKPGPGHHDHDDSDQLPVDFRAPEGPPMSPMKVGNGYDPIEDGSMVFGRFGKLTVNMDGSYCYDLDELNKQVIKLAEGEKAQEVFHYTIVDSGGKTDEATLTITIVGSNDGPKASDDTNWVKAGMVVHCDTDDSHGHGRGDEAEPDGWKPMQWVDGKEGEPGRWAPMDWDRGEDGMPCGCPDEEAPALAGVRGGEGQGGVWVPGENGWPSGWMPDGMPDDCDGPPVVWMPMKWIPGDAGSEGTWAPVNGNHGDEYDRDWRPEGDMDCDCAPMGMPPVWTPEGWIMPSSPDHESYKVVMKAPIIKGELIEGEYNGWIKEGREYDNFDNAQARPGGDGNYDKTHFADVADKDWDNYDVLKVSKVVAWKPGTGDHDHDDSDQGPVDFRAPEGPPMPPMMVGNGYDPIEDGSMVFGRFGKLTVNMDGSYSYDLDEWNEAVIKLAEGEKTEEVFHYTVVDSGGKTDEATLTITIVGSNDGPVAKDDINMVKAGMVAYGDHSEGAMLARIIKGNVIGELGEGGPGRASSNGDQADMDPDYGDSLIISRVESVNGNVKNFSINTQGSKTIEGKYGKLIIHKDGSYKYDLNDFDEDIVKLSRGEIREDEVFTYTVVDSHGKKDTATLTIIVKGSNDGPVAIDDMNMVKAGMVAYGDHDAMEADIVQGNVIGDLKVSNGPGLEQSYNDVADFDYDSGDKLRVTNVSSPLEYLADVTPDRNGEEIKGKYGTLTMYRDGSYKYDLDDEKGAVVKLAEGEKLEDEIFTYTVSDGKKEDEATLTIVIKGSNDGPVACDDINSVRAGMASYGDYGEAMDSRVVKGNVIGEEGENKPGPGYDPSNRDKADYDPDNGDSLRVSRVSTEAGGGNSTGVSKDGETISGKYGELTIYRDGSYEYHLDDENSYVLELGEGDKLRDEVFTYTVTDGDKKDTATLKIIIKGTNDGPTACDDMNMVKAGMVAYGGHDDNAMSAMIIKGNVIGYLGEDRPGPGYETSYDDCYDSDPDHGASLKVLKVDGENVGRHGEIIEGKYGSLTIFRDGSYEYDLNDYDGEVIALDEYEELDEEFVYTVSDGDKTDTATLTIVIKGSNDGPTAHFDTNMVKAGMIAYGENEAMNIPKVIKGDVLENDTDPDIEPLMVTEVKSTNGNQAAPGDDGIRGEYGKLTIQSDGSYKYNLFDNNNTVVALGEGETINEVFWYTVSDGEKTDISYLQITIEGSNDGPSLSSDVTNGSVYEAAILNNTMVSDEYLSTVGKFEFSDPDGDPLSISVNGQQLGVLDGNPDESFAPVADSEGNGQLTVFKDGSWKYELTEGGRLSKDYPDMEKFDVTVSDGSKVSSTVTLEIDIIEAAKPIVDLNGEYDNGKHFQNSFTAKSSSVAVTDGDVAITDADNSDLKSAKVEITNPKNGDQLSVTGNLPAGISLGAGSTSSMIVLLGMASLEDYETALSQIRFENTRNNPNNTDRVIEVTVTDESGLTSNVRTSTIEVFDQITPIAIDLDGDGLEFQALSENPIFDLDGDGTLDRSAWVGADDALLVFDTNGNGVADNGSEIAFAEYAEGAETDLEGLALAFDSNGDGVFDANDSEFANFGIWQDENSNGITDEGEFTSLADAGIVSIDLESDGITYSSENGDVTVFGEGTFAFADGSQGTLGDVAFSAVLTDLPEIEDVLSGGDSGESMDDLLASVVESDDSPGVSDTSSPVVESADAGPAPVDAPALPDPVMDAPVAV